MLQQICAVIVLFAAVPTFAATRPDEIRKTIQDFHKNPKKVMQRPLVKRDRKGNVVRQIRSLFTQRQIETREFVTLRDQQRNQMVRRFKAPDAKAAPYGHDRVEDLVDGAWLVRRLEEIQSRGLMSVGLEVEPWSDDYWPYYRGLLGARYADPKFPTSKNFHVNRQYVLQNPVDTMLYYGVGDRLSPSEKYDLLVGDERGTFTEANWGQGESLANYNGEVPTWMGLCQGWAAASIMMDRPFHVITLPAANRNAQVTFYPSDIKALATGLWAFGQRGMRFVGGRCEDPDPATDINGRIISDTCFDTNPMTWHLAVANQIGVFKRSFVIDATYDYEVWNQPMFGYTYTYFNPSTGETAGDLASARIPLRNFWNDKFSPYRSSNAAYVVGIAMDVTYMVETDPVQRPTDHWTYDAAVVVRYLYDLELDAYGDLVGGEWYTQLHPDFLWNFPPNARAVSPGDSMLTEPWNGSSRLPVSWQEAAPVASSYGLPLAAVVEKLIEMARR